MVRTSDIFAFTDQMVADCRLDTTSIFFVDWSGEDSRVSYLYHAGVSAEAQHVYAARGIFRHDPFAQITRRPEVGREFVQWGDARLDIGSSDCSDYRSFLSQHDIGVVGALSRRISPHLNLVIGTHRSRDGHRHDEVPLRQLDHQIGRLSDMVAEHMLEELLESSAGRIALQMVLPSATAEKRSEFMLSNREIEIASLICGGKQNKHVAHALNISQFTVENHLRRIYRKLGIHTRAALAAHFVGRVH